LGLWRQRKKKELLYVGTTAEVSSFPPQVKKEKESLAEELRFLYKEETFSNSYAMEVCIIISFATRFCVQ
jgi:hypothetical protein